MFQNGMENVGENIKTLKYGAHLREPFKYFKVRGKNNVFKINSNTTYKANFSLKYSIISIPNLWKLKPKIRGAWVAQ